MKPRFFDFAGNTSGQWTVIDMKTVLGEALPAISHLSVIEQPQLTASSDELWCLKGVRSNIRYAERTEKDQLLAIQAELGRPTATLAAMIPIRKSDAWWSMAQDERRQIFENQSGHTQTGLRYLPAIARQLYHCRDLGQPFDFITWFEYAPADADAFDELVYALRQTEEWTYVDREVDIRLQQLPTMS